MRDDVCADRHMGRGSGLLVAEEDDAGGDIRGDGREREAQGEARMGGQTHLVVTDWTPRGFSDKYEVAREERLRGKEVHQAWVGLGDICDAHLHQSTLPGVHSNTKVVGHPLFRG